MLRTEYVGHAAVPWSGHLCASMSVTACLLSHRAHDMHDAPVHCARDTLQEFYADFIVVDPHHFTIPCARPALLMSAAPRLKGQPSSE